MGRTPYDIETRMRIARLYSDGLTPAMIAGMGLASKPTIIKIAKEYGVVRRHGGARTDAARQAVMPIIAPRPDAANARERIAPGIPVERLMGRR